MLSCARESWRMLYKVMKYSSSTFLHVRFFFHRCGEEKTKLGAAIAIARLGKNVTIVKTDFSNVEKVP